MAETDFGIRTLAPILSVESKPQNVTPTEPVSLNRAVLIGSQFGVVTSTRRTVQHNRYVGGVPNSYHLSGRAIDIARRPGVGHGQIAEAYRAAGLQLVESLDEGDHSHFAFQASTVARRRLAQSSTTALRFVLAPQ